MFFRAIFLLVLVGLSLAQKDADTDAPDVDRSECGPCDPSACPSDLSCRSERVPDRCSCCQVCAKLRGERCGGPESADGRCADEYICAGRSVYEPVEEGQVGQCVCKNFESVCGTDGAVYKSICDLKMASYERTEEGESAIDVDKTDELCMTVPVITVPPANSRLRLDSQSELSCEAEGRPIPNLIWSKDGEELPGNHLNIATRKRNGPSKFAMTSWVLLNVSPDDAGLYTCTARNSLGEISATATIVVTDQEETEDTGANNIALEL